MTGREQELIERYIYQVTRRLPKDQRDDVALELGEMIGDMIEGKGSTAEKVLTELGDPARLAEQYQDVTHCLIGPEYYDTYLWFVKVVLLCSILPVLAAGVVDAVRLQGAGAAEVYVAAYAMTESAFVLYGILQAMLNAAASGVTAFGAVTLVFVILERQKVKLEKRKERQWKVEDLENASAKRFSGWTPGALSPVPNPKARISRGDCIVEMGFTVIFGGLLIFAPEFFSAVFREGEMYTVVPVFNLDLWEMLLPLFILSLGVGLVDQAVRLAAGVYGRLVLVSNLVCNGISLVLSVILLKVTPLWNPNFAVDLQTYLKWSMDESVPDFLLRFNGDTISNILLAIIVFAVLLDSGTTVYKTLRYGVHTLN